MNSQFKSARHSAIHATREALREHAIDQNNTGTPARIIGILKSHGFSDPNSFLMRLLEGSPSAGDRRKMKKIPISLIQPVPQKNTAEEPKHRVKHTPPSEQRVPGVSGARIARGAPASRPQEDDDIVFANPDTEVSAGRNYFSIPVTPEVLPQGHVRIHFGSLTEVGTGGTIISEETWGNIKLLKKAGKLIIEDRGEHSVTFDFEYRGGMIYRTEMKTDLENTIAAIVEELKWKGVIAPEEKIESQQPSTVRIYLENLEKCSSWHKNGGVEVSSETLVKIEALKGLGTLTAMEQYRGGYRFRFNPAETGGPHTGGGLTVDEAMENLWGHLQEIGKVGETPSDTVNIDIDDLRECTGTGPGVETIPRKILNDIVKLNGLGRIVIIKEDIGGFSIEYYSNGNKDSFSGQTIEEIIPHIVWMMRAIYPDRFES